MVVGVWSDVMPYTHKINDVNKFTHISLCRSVLECLCMLDFVSMDMCASVHLRVCVFSCVCACECEFVCVSVRACVRACVRE